MIALRNLLLFLFGVSIPVVVAFGQSVLYSNGWLSSFVVYALWGYVVVLFADGYLKLLGAKED